MGPRRARGRQARHALSCLFFSSACSFLSIPTLRDMMSLDGAEVALGLFPPVMEHIYLSENAHLEKWRGV